jgi:hypothetical protein
VDTQLLIDNIVRQTTVLIAQLATSSGGRAPLSHVAGQVFLELVQELRAQGLGNKLIADMFGMALRTYRERVRRLSESASDRGATLWEAVIRYVSSHKVISRAEVLRRFAADDPQSVRAVLNDLVQSGLLFRSGREDTTTYRAAQADERVLDAPDASERALLDTAWVVLHQQGPLSAAELASALRLDVPKTQGAIDRLIELGQVKSAPGDAVYSVEHCVIPLGATFGWEAALLDHYQAVVTTMVNKIGSGARLTTAGAVTGGSTYHFDLYPGHPQEQEILHLLATVRQRAGQLRQAALEHPAPPNQSYRVVFYAGQDVRNNRVDAYDSSLDANEDENDE